MSDMFILSGDWLQPPEASAKTAAHPWPIDHHPSVHLHQQGQRGLVQSFTILLGLFSSFSRSACLNSYVVQVNSDLQLKPAVAQFSQRGAAGRTWPSVSVCPPLPSADWLVVCGYDQMMGRLTTCGRASLVVGNQQAPPPWSWPIQRMKQKTQRREENRESSRGSGFIF